MLKKLISRSLRKQGFKIRRGKILPPDQLDKEKIRSLHATAVLHKIAKARSNIARYESQLLKCIASGADVCPERVAPLLVEVKPGSMDELLFRYASLHWSVPVSSGYGRRLRFLVIDGHNGKLIGLFGLGDPVFALAARDSWVGWDFPTRRQRLRHVMDAFVLGAVPPYSWLLCGKLVAMLAASSEVRNRFAEKYGGTQSVIAEHRFDGRLALITTTSALGRSSIYNRINYQGRTVFNRVGYTRGSGDFHFSNGLYADIWSYASKYCEATAKHDRWGTGFRSRREVVKKLLAKIGVSTEWLYHGVEREVFAVPLARNTREFLRGEQRQLDWFDARVSEIANFFRDRWLIPRSGRDAAFRAWSPEDWKLWEGPAARGEGDGGTYRIG
jgi:hypothetical protein